MKYPKLEHPKKIWKGSIDVLNSWHGSKCGKVYVGSHYSAHSKKDFRRTSLIISSGYAKIKLVTSKLPFKLSSTNLKKSSVSVKVQVFIILSFWVLWISFINSFIWKDLLGSKFKMVIVVVFKPRQISESPFLLDGICNLLITVWRRFSYFWEYVLLIR